MNFARRFWPKSRGKRWIAVGVSMLLFLSALWTAAFFATERQVNEAWDFTDRFGLPNDFAELLGPRIPPEENAAVPFQEAIAMAIEALAESPQFKSSEYSISPEMVVSPTKLLESSNYESLLIEADRRPEYRALVDDDRPNTYGSYWFAMDSLRLASTEVAIAQWMAENGRVKEAVHRYLRLLRINRKMRAKTPSMWGPICSIDVEQKICHELNHILRDHPKLDVYDAIESAVGGDDDDVVRNCLFAVHAERLASLYICEYYAPLGDALVFRPYAALDERYALDYFNRSMQHLFLPAMECVKRQKELEASTAANSKEWFHRIVHPISSEGLTSLSNLHPTIHYAVATSRCLRIVNAMARKGDFSLPLDALGLPPECLIDPYDGKRLRLKSIPEGTIVYTVYENLVDDGGDFRDLKDLGMWPRLKAKKK